MDRTTLENAQMEALREVGYALEEEPEVDGEVREREKSDLVDAILEALDAVSDNRGRAILESNDVLEPAFDEAIIRVAANTTKSDLSINDIVVDPPEELLDGLPHEQLDGPAEARERLKRPECRLNETYSRSELPNVGEGGDPE
jgi:hypothetical protein